MDFVSDSMLSPERKAKRKLENKSHQLSKDQRVLVRTGKVLMLLTLKFRSCQTSVNQV